ncbi:hypothetical protein [Cronobacter sp. JZ38]|uniref:hypothetical protein n=1 Tax=Cronobacter sp. JZ38 TaxID=1906275 RepID=UPI0015528982|nr:hypothetical protein [Cronobacter sp. JZ38]ELY2495258.1 hypothetical protein [Cronobacter muytjensii]ELY4156472.1 hypothetical protein [Cronobacter turicensis]ELY4385899.1 hypothetical protein [Cronobacter turicensis]ELY6269895.1 hypothetical protein [Cronobacter turicensis]
MDIFENIWDWLSIPSISSLIGIIGVLFAIVSIILTRSVSKISSHLEYKNLIGAFHSVLPQNISITYDDVPVDKVSSSVFTIWSSGNKVIYGNSLKTINPFRIEAREGVRILRYNIQKVNNKTNNITIKNDPHFHNSLLISFDFLERKNGFRIEILHTGTREDLIVRGQLIDVKSLEKKQNAASHKTYRLLSKNLKAFKSSTKIAFFIIIITLLVALTYSFIQPEFFIRPKPQSAPLNIWTFRAIVTTYLAVPLYFLYRSRPPYPSSLRAENSEPDN